FYQLLQFILYKAALRGVMVIEADPAYTSQECSRCHQLTKPNGKKFVCGKCGHNDHRDANAAFSLAERVMPIGGVVGDSVRSDSGDRKSTRLNSSHDQISYAVFCLKKKKKK